MGFDVWRVGPSNWPPRRNRETRKHPRDVERGPGPQLLGPTCDRPSSLILALSPESARHRRKA